ncbi:unnamed protein product [Pleuronectes platessa]|uniref:Uncharacterized protein n=1 Tax=Pleuronectes platessa TaxID=8262 RepID=A0A9N7THH0_PLEPL|nr:unnamed protein product [Pleuronectes platessa]
MQGYEGLLVGPHWKVFPIQCKVVAGKAIEHPSEAVVMDDQCHTMCCYVIHLHDCSWNASKDGGEAVAKKSNMGHKRCKVAAARMQWHLQVSLASQGIGTSLLTFITQPPPARLYLPAAAFVVQQSRQHKGLNDWTHLRVEKELVVKKAARQPRPLQ